MVKLNDQDASQRRVFRSNTIASLGAVTVRPRSSAPNGRDHLILFQGLPNVLSNHAVYTLSDDIKRFNVSQIIDEVLAMVEQEDWFDELDS